MDPIIEVLKMEYEKRRAKNHLFSMRSYSKFLGIDPSNLNKIINYKKAISRQTIQKIQSKLNLTDSIIKQMGLIHSSDENYLFLENDKRQIYFSIYIEENNYEILNQKIQNFVIELKPFICRKSDLSGSVRLSISAEVLPKN